LIGGASLHSSFFILLSCGSVDICSLSPHY
jgi:hypothetical protein